ncbi:cysteine-rich receptor-like protein kinase 15 [Aegilops tauschii subsp. strangulata]|uniref:cysteine-rich receptor-like protein kinase 15 n=1 Tax=Aegilops tauschii subsp. strangulata TaxID=200361 RepID=UPI003CC89195
MVRNHIMLFLLLLVTLLTSGRDQSAVSASPVGSVEPFRKCTVCTGALYEPNSTYRSNLEVLGAALVAGAGANGGFAKASIGVAPDAVYGLALCRGDCAGPNCTGGLAAAFRGAAELYCPSRRDATVYYDNYTLRFSGEDFLSALTEQPRCSGWSDSGESGWDAAQLLAERVEELMKETIKHAAATAKRYGTGRVWVRGRAEAADMEYVLAQCTPDLTEAECWSCLNDTRGKLQTSSMHDKVPTSQYGGRLVGVRCSLRYERVLFFEETSSTLQLHKPKVWGMSTVNKITIIGVVPFLVLLILCLLLVLKRIRESRLLKELALWEKEIMNESNSGFSLYKFAEVNDATENFSKRVGEGGFGPVFQGKLPNGEQIAVKRLKLNSLQGLVEFKNEIRLIAKLQHINLVRLLGCCIEGNERMLVYEYMPERSLDSFIIGIDIRFTSWHVRARIIEGIAQGLLYIHEQSHLCVVHRDLKPSNILLDSEMNPKISDFGIARICPSNIVESNTTTVVGTIGYMAPEYFSQKIYSTKSDIFSFGILLLEIISGKVAFGSYKINGRSYDLRRYAWLLWRDEKCKELIDPSLREEYQKVEMIRCTQIALLCVQESADDRPTMREINMMLHNGNIILPMPTQPGYFDISPSIMDSSSPTDMVSSN